MRKLILGLILLFAASVPLHAQLPPLYAVNAKYLGLGTGGGTANAQTVTYSPTTAGYTDGQVITWLPSHANSGAATMAVDGHTAHSIVKFAGTALASGDLTTTAKAVAIYNSTGTVFELQNPQTTPTGAVTSISGDGTIISNSGSTGAVTLTLANTPTGTGSVVLANTPTLITPVIGAATGTSLLASGIIDGVVPIGISTGTSCTLGTTSGCTSVAYKHAYQFNQEATAGTGVTYTLPATATGLQYCVANSGTTGVVNTGVLTVYPPSSSYIIYNGVVNTVGGGGTHGIASAGAAGDGACFVAIDSTHWQVYVQSGTWAEN